MIRLCSAPSYCSLGLNIEFAPSFPMWIKSVQEAELCFQVRPAGKEVAEYSRSIRSILSPRNTSACIFTSLRFAPLESFNESLISEITHLRFSPTLLMSAIKKKNTKKFIKLFLLGLDCLNQRFTFGKNWRQHFSWKEYAENLHRDYWNITIARIQLLEYQAAHDTT